MTAIHSLAYRWELVVILWLAYFLHQADKQIYSVLLLPIQRELGLSGYEAGLVNTVFTLVVALMSPLAGALGDRYPKARILLIAVFVWSLGTLLSGVAGGLAVMLLSRSLLTGGAESFYPPVSHALLADYHSKTRALAISIHQTAQYAGPIVSGFAAGWIAERAGWRSSFIVFGGLGVMLGLWMLWRLKNTEAVGAVEPLLAGFAHCLRIAAVRRIGYAFAAVLFVWLGYGTWAPAIFGKQFRMSLSQAGFQTALWGNAFAMVGALVGGAWSDKAAARGRSRFELQAAALLCASPFLWLLGAAESLPWAIVALAGTGFFQGIYQGTIAVTLYDYVDARYRSSAAAVVLIIANLLAAPSAALLGWMSDRANLELAVSGLSVFFVIGAAILWSGRSMPTRSTLHRGEVELT